MPHFRILRTSPDIFTFKFNTLLEFHKSYNFQLQSLLAEIAKFHKSENFPLYSI